MAMTDWPDHGGPGPGGPARFDFSTNAHPGGPCPAARAAVQAANPCRYPDARYEALREQLAAHHGVTPGRVLLAASASEFIQRITAVGLRLAPGAVAVPARAYGDYARAARAWGREVLRVPAMATRAAAATSVTPAATVTTPATLRWHADPSSPLGQDDPPDVAQAETRYERRAANRDEKPHQGSDEGLDGGLDGGQDGWLDEMLDDRVDEEPQERRDEYRSAERPAFATVLDAVYAPLRLSGKSAWSGTARDAVFVLHSPNKALGLCGVRGAYVLAPAGAPWRAWVQALLRTSPSWPLGAQGVALLQAWCRADVQHWLQGTLPALRAWKAAQQAALLALGCRIAPSHTPFFCLQPPWPLRPATLAAHGVQLRDAASFGLPGWWRVNSLPPPAQRALLAAIGACRP